MTNSEKLFLKALLSMAESSPSSVLGDLFMLFPKDVVVKLVVTFAGDKIEFPKLETVWNTYRANVIVSTLRAKNDAQTRQKLARYFGISTRKVSEIFCSYKVKEKKVTDKLLTKSVRRAYRYQLDELLKDVKNALHQ
jgi:hypothetical protein